MALAKSRAKDNKKRDDNEVLMDDMGFIKQRWKESMAKVMKTC